MFVFLQDRSLFYKVPVHRSAIQRRTALLAREGCGYSDRCYSRIRCRTHATALTLDQGAQLNKGKENSMPLMERAHVRSIAYTSQLLLSTATPICKQPIYHHVIELSKRPLLNNGDLNNHQR